MDGVVDGAKAADHGTPAVSELVQVLLPDQDCSSLLEPYDERRISRGNFVPDDPAPRARADPGYVHEIFQPYRNAV
jgi:hypothetical protein